MGALRRLAVAGVVSLCVLVGGLAFGSVGALAVLTNPFAGKLAPAGGSFGFLNAGSVAVNDSNGDTYVADSGTGTVDVFDPAGTRLASLDGALTPAGSFGGGETEPARAGTVAVAANNGTGEVYVLDSTHGVVDVFDPAGGYMCQITGNATPSASECNGVAGSATPAGGFNAPGGITVDQATGDVYVVDANNGVVDVFSSGGAYLRQILLGAIPGGFSASYTRGVAVDDFNGHVYVSDSGSVVVYEFDAAGSYVTTWTGGGTPAGSFGGGFLSVAADNVTGELYVTETADEVTDVFDASGAYLRQFGLPANRPLGTAVDQASGSVYVSDIEPAVVDVFEPAAVLPDAVTGSPSGVQPRGVMLAGSVNPEGVQLSGCRFDYGTDTAYGQSAPCAPVAGAIPADASEHAVSAELTGLQPGTTYHFRLEASNANCPHCTSFGADTTFATPPPPAIEGAQAASVTSASADLGAQVDPEGLSTTYHFEWGTTSAYGTSIPVPDGDLAAGTSPVPVSVHLSGLATNTTYHWRVVASSASGTTATGDHTFIYDTGGPGLPDNRAYEMVTPPQKNGALVGAVLNSESAISEDGSRLILPSIQCFVDADSCTGLRLRLGTPYAFSRTASRWATTALAPSATRYGPSTSWAFSADAGTALFSVETPPFGEDDWYARQLDGSISDVGPVSPPAGGVREQSFSRLTGESILTTADLSHVVWGDNPDWPLDPSFVGLNRPSLKSSVYEYVGMGNSVPILVGVKGGAGSTDLISACSTHLSYRLPGSLSTDGRTVYFTAEGQDHTGSGCAGTASPPVNEVYARVDQSRTVAISQRSPSNCTAACSTSTPADAQFEGASQDGSKAFFTSAQQLTDKASQGSSNLYEYDSSNPTGQNLIAASAGESSGEGPGVLGLLGLSADGSHVYFVAHGVLSPVANDQGQAARAGADNLYVFERDGRFPNGHVAFVAAMADSDVEEWTTGAEAEANVTPDGRFLVFTSHGQLTRDDTNGSGAAQVFRYDAQTGVLVRISVGEQGFNDDGNAGVAGVCGSSSGETDGCTGDARIVKLHNSATAGPLRTDPTMSHDGAYVFFMSPVALTPGAASDVQSGTNEAGAPEYAQNVYEYHAGRVYLISDGRDVSSSFSAPCTRIVSSVCLLGTDATGTNVFFTTAAPLVGEDTDTQVDVYDARVCTSSEPCIAPHSPPATPCDGEACRGAPATAPVAPGAGTVTFGGPGNLAPPAVVGPKAKAKHKIKARKHKSKRKPKRRSAHKRNGKVKARGK